MHIDQSGKPIYGRRFKAVEPFYNGQARVEEFNGALEVIDESGSTLVSLRSPLRSEFAALSGDLVGFWRTQTIATAVELGVVDALPASRQQIADKCSISTDSAYRILRALGELGIAVRRDDLWALTERGEFLRADHPLTLSDAAIEYAGPFTSMWRKLADAMREGADWQPPDIFSEVAQSDTRCASHHRMLQSYARHDYATISDVLSLRGDEKVIDAGGGLGVLASALLKRYPSLDITVLERPEVVSMATDSMPGLSWLSGNLFSSWGVQTDVVVLSRVLHDWDDERAVQILKNARGVLPEGGRLFIIEMIVPDNGMFGALCDLHLMMATGGCERSVSHFERLLNLSGFELTEVRNTEALPSVVVGVAL